MDFKTYLRTEKVKWLQKFSSDFKKDFGVDLPHGTGFTTSDFFHFGPVENLKYVHKEAMHFLLTNGLTYNGNCDLYAPTVFNQNQMQKDKVDSDIALMFDFYRYGINQCKLYPSFIKESENFFVFEFYSDTEWTAIDYLTREDAQFIKKHYIDKFEGITKKVTPFYCSLADKLFRHNKTGEIKMVDIKSFEFRSRSGLTILMVNDRVNNLYLLERRFLTRSYILSPFKKDYNVRETALIKLY